MPLFRTAFAAATGALLSASVVGAPIQADTPLQVLPGATPVPASPVPPPAAAPVAAAPPVAPAAAPAPAAGEPSAAAPAAAQPALSITPAQAAALKAISEGQREAAKRQAEEQRPSGGDQSPAAAAADAQRDARKAEAEARHEAMRREAEARQQEHKMRIEEQQAAAQRDREAQRAAIEQSQKARPERPAAAEGAARPTAEEWERYQADLQKWRDERAAQMAEQRRRLQERLDAAIDRMPSPPMVRPQEPSLDWAPPTPPFRGEYSAPAFPQADPPRYWYPAYSYGPPSGAYPGAAPGAYGYGAGGLPSR